MKSILVVEDDPTHAKIISDLLTARGYRVRIARTGPAGVESFSESPADLVLIDINLPEKNGFSVAADIRSTPPGESIPLLLMSAVPENRRRFGEGERPAVRVDGHIDKPFRLMELLARVQSFIGKA